MWRTFVRTSSSPFLVGRCFVCVFLWLAAYWLANAAHSSTHTHRTEFTVYPTNSRCASACGATRASSLQKAPKSQGFSAIFACWETARPHGDKHTYDDHNINNDDGSIVTTIPITTNDSNNFLWPCRFSAFDLDQDFISIFFSVHRRCSSGPSMRLFSRNGSGLQYLLLQWWL